MKHFGRLKKIQVDQRKDGHEDVGNHEDELRLPLGGVCSLHPHNQVAPTSLKHLPNRLPRDQECQTGQGASPWDEGSQ